MKNANSNYVVGDAIADNIFQGNTNFSIEVEDKVFDCVTIENKGAKCIYCGISNDFKRGNRFYLYPYQVLHLTAIYIDRSKILLLDYLNSTRSGVVSFEEIRSDEIEKVLSAVNDYADQHCDLDELPTPSSIWVEKLAWLIALNDFFWEDVFPCAASDAENNELIYAALTGNYSEVASSWFFKYYAEVHFGKACYNAAVKESEKYKDDPLVDLFKKLKNSEHEVFTLVMSSKGEMYRNLITKDNLLHNIRTRNDSSSWFFNYEDDDYFLEILDSGDGDSEFWKKGCLE